jgi:hypothetical protein
MSTTVTTHHRTPLAAAAAVAAVIAGAGLFGVAVVNSDGSVSPDQGPALRAPTPQDYSQYRHYYPGARPLGGGARVPATPSTSGGHVQIGP